MDQKDKAILEALQRDATLTVGELADRVGLSRSACWRRVQNLEESGIIAARVTLLDQDALGLKLTVYTTVRTHEHTAQWFDRFRRVTASMSNVLEVHRMSGDVDYLMRSVAPNMQHYDDFYQEMISRINLFDVSSSFSMETIKQTTALPLDYL